VKLTLETLNQETVDFCSAECACQWLVDRLKPKSLLTLPNGALAVVGPDPVADTNPKMHTGNPRLDDLLFGGFPKGSNVLIMGPAFIGKEVLTNVFLAEGRGNGEKTVVLNTDCTPDDIEGEWEIMTDGRTGHGNLPSFVDVYSKPMGLDISPDARHIYLTDPTGFDEILRAIESLSEHKPFRLVVRSISTLLSYSDATKVYKFLQQLTSLVKKTGSVALYLIDPGMHTDPEIQTLGHLVDGSITFRTDGVKTFLSIQGIDDCQSRAWVQYQYNKKGLTLGSFALDKVGK
jgi:KaiC/GvpD/RAD55 family RecA-like ATPase